MLGAPIDAALVRPARRASGSVQVPGDKSISHRSLMLGALGSPLDTLLNLLAGLGLGLFAGLLLGMLVFDPLAEHPAHAKRRRTLWIDPTRVPGTEANRAGRNFFRLGHGEERPRAFVG